MTEMASNRNYAISPRSANTNLNLTNTTLINKLTKSLPEIPRHHLRVTFRGVANLPGSDLNGQDLTPAPPPPSPSDKSWESIYTTPPTHRRSCKPSNLQVAGPQKTDAAIQTEPVNIVTASRGRTSSFKLPWVSGGATGSQKNRSMSLQQSAIRNPMHLWALCRYLGPEFLNASPLAQSTIAPRHHWRRTSTYRQAHGHSLLDPDTGTDYVSRVTRTGRQSITSIRITAPADPTQDCSTTGVVSPSRQRFSVTSERSDVFSDPHPTQEDDVTVEERITSCQKSLRTLLVAAAYFAVAITLSIMGPTLLELEAQTASGIRQSVLLFVGRAGGEIAGTVLMVALVDRVNQLMTLGLSLVLVAVFTAMVPRCSQAIGMVAMFSLQGVGLGYIDNAVSSMCLAIWGARNARYLHLIYFTYGIGTIIGPLMTGPFLTVTPPNQLTNTTRSDEFISDLTIKNEFRSDGETSTVRNLLSNGMLQQTDSFVTQASLHLQTELSDVLVTTVFGNVQVDLEFGTVYFTAAALCIAVALGCGLMWFISERTVILQNNQPERTPLGERPPRRLYANGVIALIAAVQFIGEGTQFTYENYMPKYAVHYFNWNAVSASQLISAHYGAFTVGRGLGILAATFLHPGVVIVTNCILLTVSLTVQLTLGLHSPGVLWLAAVGLGLGMSTIQPASLIWLQCHVTLTSRVVMILMISASLGTVILPLIVGLMMSSFGFLLLDIILLAAVVVLTACFLASVYMASECLDKSIQDKGSPLLDENANVHPLGGPKVNNDEQFIRGTNRGHNPQAVSIQHNDLSTCSDSTLYCGIERCNTLKSLSVNESPFNVYRVGMNPPGLRPYPYLPGDNGTVISADRNSYPDSSSSSSSSSPSIS